MRQLKTTVNLLQEVIDGLRHFDDNIEILEKEVRFWRRQFLKKNQVEGTSSAAYYEFLFAKCEDILDKGPEEVLQKMLNECESKDNIKL